MSDAVLTLILAGIGSAGAIGAAVASWAAVSQARSLSLDARQPDLVATSVWNPLGPRQEIDLRNLGSGFALSVKLLLVLPEVAGVKEIATAIAPGDGLRISVTNGPTEMPEEGSVSFVVYCRDWTNTPHAVSLDGRRERFERLEGPRELAFTDVWARFYSGLAEWSTSPPMRYAGRLGVTADVDPLPF
jgi:hypothetical protein